MNVCVECGKECANEHLEACPDCSGPLVRLRTEGESLVGRALGDKYLLLEQLGEGGMGSVYRARHRQLDKMVAIKVLRLAFANRKAAMQRFYAEARHSSRLKHPHNVNVTDFGHTEDGLVYLAMDLVEGTPLSQLEKPMAADRALKIMSQVCHALAEAHDMGLIHRDLKPDNIMVSQVDKTDFARILDYGVAKMADCSHGLTEEGVIIGTPEYMSPEQILGQKLDGRCDIYSLGLILYEMVTGRTPFRGSDAVAVLYQHRHERPPLPSAFAPVPRGVESLIMHCLAKDREARPASVVELAHCIENLLVDGMGQIAEPRLAPAGMSPRSDDTSHARHARADGSKRWQGTDRPATSRVFAAPVLGETSFRHRTAYRLSAVVIATVALMAIAVLLVHSNGDDAQNAEAALNPGRPIVVTAQGNTLDDPMIGEPLVLGFSGMAVESGVDVQRGTEPETEARAVDIESEVTIHGQAESETEAHAIENQTTWVGKTLIGTSDCQSVEILDTIASGSNVSDELSLTTGLGSAVYYLGPNGDDVAGSVFTDCVPDQELRSDEATSSRSSSEGASSRSRRRQRHDRATIEVANPMVSGVASGSIGQDPPEDQETEQRPLGPDARDLLREQSRQLLIVPTGQDGN